MYTTLVFSQIESSIDSNSGIKFIRSDISENNIIKALWTNVSSTTLSICEQPTLFVPAMNFRMWRNPATVKAVNILRNRKKIVLNPEEGKLASLHYGEGRLPDIKIIMNSIIKYKMTLRATFF